MGHKMFMEVQQYLHVAHHVPGRIRIKFDARLAQHPKARELINAGNTFPGITGVRMNLGARSVIIEYDRERISPEWVQELFTACQPERIQEMIDEAAEMFNAETRR